MTYTLICIGYTLFVFVCGFALGATLVRDWLDDRPSRLKRTRKPRLPLARVLTRAECERLEIPTVRRRQRIEVIR